ncbi:MAG: hypothetical protein M1376_21490 [Planctomycetes bacterium]|nr:hypothetical protein [Planctomycetota bacterium]
MDHRTSHFPFPRWFSRSEWLIRLLRLAKTPGSAGEPGLVLIQIDGLSRGQFQRALDEGHLPFLARLLRERGYRLHSLYSGMPSSTPAMTAELLYGVKGAVPSFSFYSRPNRAIFRMFDARPARQVDQRLRGQGPPLLVGGSAYACIYTGGAAETHFCACTMALDDLLRRRYPLRLFIILLFSVYSLIRVGVLLALEFLLALFDCARGLIAGQDLWKELKFVPSRVGVSILMRELATIGAKIDVARGLPVIYLDLVGYDEQAHRRGPGSRFAHWSLKGIDGAIARIWKAAQRSSQRPYGVWVFSDHGSEATVSYLQKTGRTLQEAITAVFGGAFQTFVGEHDVVGTPFHRTRRSLAGRSSIRPRVTRSRESGKPLIEHREPIVAAMGPIGHVYIDQQLDPEERSRFARSLIERAQIPTVAAVEDRDHVRVWTKEGQFILPDDAALVFPREHPFLADLVADLMAVCRHPDAGDFVLWGWDRSGLACAFSMESGSHGGPGLEETHAFALLPAEAPIRVGAKGYLRPLDLRQAVLEYLGRVPHSGMSRPPAASARVGAQNAVPVHSMPQSLLVTLPVAQSAWP